MQSILVVVISLLIGFTITLSWATPLALVFMALTAATFISLGLILGSLINDFQGFQLVTQFFTLPLFFLSNSIIPLSTFPSYVRYIAYANPLTYGIDGLRNTLLGSGAFPIWVDLLAMLVSTFIMISIAAYAFSKTNVG